MEITIHLSAVDIQKLNSVTSVEQTVLQTLLLTADTSTRPKKPVAPLRDFLCGCQIVPCAGSSVHELYKAYRASITDCAEPMDINVFHVLLADLFGTKKIGGQVLICNLVCNVKDALDPKAVIDAIDRAAEMGFRPKL